MNTDTVILALIGIAFLGFLTGLIGKNTNKSKKKSFRGEEFFKYLMAISVIVMLLLLIIYNFM